MNEKLTAAQPPIFFALHASSISAASRSCPEADGLLIDVPSQHMRVAVSMTAGVIVRWVIESPVGVDEIGERHAQLAKTGKKYIALTMHTDQLMPIVPKVRH